MPRWASAGDWEELLVVVWSSLLDEGDFLLKTPSPSKDLKGSRSVNLDTLKSLNGPFFLNCFVSTSQKTSKQASISCWRKRPPGDLCVLCIADFKTCTSEIRLSQGVGYSRESRVYLLSGSKGSSCEHHHPLTRNPARDNQSIVHHRLRSSLPTTCFRPMFPTLDRFHHPPFHHGY